MIVLDTNVLSLRPRPDAGVPRWIGRQTRIGTTAVLPYDLEAARACGCRLATRNVRDFHGLDLVVVNPWEES